MKTNPLLHAGLLLAGLTPHALAQYQGWQHQGSLYILTTPEGADLPATASVEGFPLLLRLDKASFDFTQTQPAGADIRVSANGKPLPYQIDQWDAATGTAAIWVKIPKIQGNTQQEIKLHWGKPGAASESNGAAVFGADNGYASVIHMADPLKDEVGTVTPADGGTTTAAGVVGSARHFTAGKGIAGGKNITTYPFGDSPFTSECWFRAESAGTTILYWGRYAKRLNGNTGDGNEVGIHVGSPPQLNWESDGPGGTTGASMLDLGKWYHVAATYENGVSSIYINGKLDGHSEHKAAMSITKDICMDIGGWRGNTYTFAGDIDEVRVSRVARSPEWLKLQYENQKPAQSLVGCLVRPGNDFQVTPATVTINEGQSIDLTAKAGGARKIYWYVKRDGIESLVAADRLSYHFDAGRVVGDTACTIRFMAVYANETKTREIPVKIKEDLPEPAFTLKAPASWNGRDTIEIVPELSNLAAMKAKGVANLKYSWSVANGAVIKEIAADKLILKRSQCTGKITVNLALGNGGTETTATATIAVTEPKTDPWVQRVPAKDEQPEDNQFYARDDKNEGVLHYNGTLDQPADAVFLKLYADDKLITTQTGKPAADKSYALSVKLKSGLINYKVEFGTKSGATERILKTVNNIACGDAYIIDGQSNAEATGPNNGPNEDPVTPVNHWIRSYGNQLEGSTRGGWGLAVRTHIWGKPDYGCHQIGSWGMVLAKNLVEKHHIPICIINGAYGGTPIWHHQPNPVNHADNSGEFYKNPYKIYGCLLTRVAAARLTHGIRGVFWHQGENDSGSGAPTGDWNYKSYQQYFIDMSAAWKSDFPNLRNYYVYQIWPLPCSMGPKDDGIREAQRTLPRLFSNLRVTSTIGAAGPHAGRGSCHFDLDTYAMFANYMTPLVEMDIYGLVPQQPVTAPDLKAATFTTPAKDEIALQFGQPVVWTDDAKKNFCLDNVVAPIASGAAAGNVITLKLKSPSTAKTITYLTGRDWDGHAENLIFGTNKIAALTFSEVPIGTK